MGFFDRSEDPAESKISRSTSQVLELEAVKKRLEMERDQINLELENLRSRMEMDIEKEQHKHGLALDSERAVFDREKKIWEKEKQELTDRAVRDKEEFEKYLTKDLEIKHNEAITLIKLESQQKIKQAELDRDRGINDLKTEHAEELSTMKSELAEDYYNKLTKAFQEIQLNGDKNSKFVQDMAMKIMDRVPASRTEIGVDVTSSANQLEAGETYEQKL